MDLIISYASSRLFGGFFSCAALVASHASRSNPSDSDFLAGRKFSFTNAYASSNTAASVTSSLASASFAVSAIARTRSTAGASPPPPTPTALFASAFAAAVATAAAAAHRRRRVPNARVVSTARRTNAAADDDDDDETSSRPIPSVDASSSRLEHDARVDPGHRARCVRNDVRDDDARDDVARGDVAGGDRPIPRVHRMVRALARRGVRERTIRDSRMRMLLRRARARAAYNLSM